jgi:hypothetical protein
MRGQGITVDQLSTFQAGKVEKVCLKDVKGQSLDAYCHKFYKLHWITYQSQNVCVQRQAVLNSCVL